MTESFYTNLFRIGRWLHDRGIFDDVISGIIVAITIATLAFIFRSTIVAFVKKLLPKLASKTPHVNFEMNSHHTQKGGWENTVVVSNAGDEPAYNVYVFYFEQFPEGNFKIKASDMNNLVTRPVLGIRDRLEFKTEGVHFDGCNVTCKQEVWVEYENSLGVAFRVVSEPGNPRGDVAQIHPPRVIKRRLEQLPGASREGHKREARYYKKGTKTLLPRPSKLSLIKWHLVTHPKYKLKDWYNRAKK